MKKRANPEPGREARVVLSVNLKKLMSEHPQLGSQLRLGKQARVAGRSIGYMLQPAKGNPTLDNIAKVAAVFRLEVWQLLHPDLALRAMGPKEIAMYEAIQRAYGEQPRQEEKTDGGRSTR